MTDPHTTFFNTPGRESVRNSLVEETISFVRESLSLWRECPDRSYAKEEEVLNAQLHNFLSCRARTDFPAVYFQTEQRQKGRRRVDLSAKPMQRTVIHGVLYTIYKPLVTIEGKRIPAPTKDREREYVTGTNGNISGGIERFKLGEHGGAHAIALLIGYVQQETPQHWHQVICDWIAEAWGTEEILSSLKKYGDGVITECVSYHSRTGGETPTIEIRHYWVQMQGCQ